MKPADDEFFEERNEAFTFVNICSFRYFITEAADNYTPDSTKVFSEKLNGRAAMLGLAIGIATEALTGKGIIDQVFGFFN